jgi:hypothetical protein
MKAFIEVKTEFAGFHRWVNAPDEVYFLRNLHRHLFKVACVFEVTHHDRQLEFFIMQDKIEEVIEELMAKPESELWSCEHWAAAILAAVNACEVRVSEDGENSAIVITEEK